MRKPRRSDEIITRTKGTLEWQSLPIVGVDQRARALFWRRYVAAALLFWAGVIWFVVSRL